MPQIQNKPFFLPLDCTETDKGLTTIGAESNRIQPLILWPGDQKWPAQQNRYTQWLSDYW